MVLTTDLYEGGNAQSMLARAAVLKASSVNLICLLALSDNGAPFYDHQNAARFAALDIPTFACTPDQFPAVMAAAILTQDIGLWAAKAGSSPTAQKANRNSEGKSASKYSMQRVGQTPEWGYFPPAQGHCHPSAVGAGVVHV